MMQKFGECKLSQFHGYAVCESPSENLLACAASENYGIAGGGALFLLDTNVKKYGHIISRLNYHSGLYDVKFGKRSSVIITGSADGKIQIWNTSQDTNVPVAIITGHEAEVYSVDFDSQSDSSIVSGSWDHSVIVWNLDELVPVRTIKWHTNMVYCTVWSNNSRCLLSASGDGRACVWDLKMSSDPAVVLDGHQSEVLSCDWSKLNPFTVVTSSVDKLIRVWDLRSAKYPLHQLIGHNYAVKNVKFSPHDQSVIASCSYDFTTRLWNYEKDLHPMLTLSYHKEFVYGLDFSKRVSSRLYDCAWDSTVNLYQSFIDT